MRRTTTLGALAAGLALIAAAPASAHHPKPKPVKVDEDRRRPRQPAPRRGREGRRRVGRRGGHRRARGRVELVLQQRRGRGLHGRERRDHAHRPLGPEARRDRARVVRGRDRRQRDRAARHLRRRQRHLLHQRRPDRAVARRRSTTQTVLRDPTLVSRGAGVALLRDAPQGGAVGQASRRRSPTRGSSRSANNVDAEVGNPLVDSNPVDVCADHGRFFIADAGGNTRAARELVGRHLAAGDLPEPRRAQPVPAAAGRPAAPADHPDAGGPHRRGQGPGRRAVHEPADRLPVPGRGSQRVPDRPAERADARSTRRGSRTSSTSTSARTARSTCSRSITTRCSFGTADGRAATPSALARRDAEAGGAPGRDADASRRGRGRQAR